MHTYACICIIYTHVQLHIHVHTCVYEIIKADNNRTTRSIPACVGSYTLNYTHSNYMYMNMNVYTYQ